jgi:hypothetical protein
VIDLAQKIVTKLPLDELWNDREQFQARRGQWLSSDELTELLRLGPVQFVVADVGAKLRWVPLPDCYRFWKSEAKPHLAHPQSQIRLDDFPDSYCFLASRWEIDNSSSVVVLERSH